MTNAQTIKRFGQYIRAGKLIQEEQRIAARARALRDRMRASQLVGASYYTSWSSNDTALSLIVPLAEYVALFPDAKPKLMTFEATEWQKAHGRLHYPEQLVPGDCGGKNLYVEAFSESFELAEVAPAEPQAVAA